MTELRQRMIEAMVVRGFAARTQDSYVDAIRRMAKHYRRDPASYTTQEVQDYLLHMVREQSLSYSTMNQAACAARFLYETVLGRSREEFLVPMAKVPQCQPELLGRGEISQLLLACGQPRQRMLLQTVYAAGLRVSEACALELRDIDSAADRMCIRVRSGKGGHDRQSILSPTLLALLAVLHTHSRQLAFHPHVYLAMPAAALDADCGAWRTLREGDKRAGYLFNHKALAKVFRARFLAAVRALGLQPPAT